MTLSWWLAGALALLCLVGAGALRPLTTGWKTEGRPSIPARLAVVARLLLASAALALITLKLCGWAQALPSPGTYAVWIGAGLLAVPWLGNLLVGLSLSLRLGQQRLGAQLSACGHQGRLRGFGITRLELESSSGGAVFLPYLALAGQPLVMSERSSAVASQVVLQQPDWTEAQLRFVRQAAVLSPYRDVSLPVVIEREGRRVVVRLSLVRPGCEAQVALALRGALSSIEDAPPESELEALPSSAHPLLPLSRGVGGK